MTIDRFLTDSFEQWLAATSTPDAVREVEHGGSAGRLWQALLDSGFADLLVAEDQGGAGGSPQTACRAVFTCAAYAAPLPIAPTMWVRAALAADGLAIPQGPIALAPPRPAGWPLVCAEVAFGAVADWVLADVGEETLLLPARAAEREPSGGYGSLAATITWNARPREAVVLPTRRDWQAIGALIFTALIGGAADQVLTLALRYAGERNQFGRPIAKFQAVQQQLSLLAEQVFAVRMAAQLAFRGDVLRPSRLLAAVAKARASEAVGDIAAIGHMVHGAIGITEEYGLQLHTRRLHEWRRQFGSEATWRQYLGEAVLQDEGTVLDFMQGLARTG